MLSALKAVFKPAERPVRRGVNVGKIGVFLDVKHG
jgi:hypothetical protein